VHGANLIINPIDDTYLKQSFQVMKSIWYVTTRSKKIISKNRILNESSLAGGSMKRLVIGARSAARPGTPWNAPATHPGMAFERLERSKRDDRE
jgi:hypothetical protein